MTMLLAPAPRQLLTLLASLVLVPWLAVAKPKPWGTVPAPSPSQYRILELFGMNVSTMCLRPMPCEEFLSEQSQCFGVPYVKTMDKSLGVDVCAAEFKANEADIAYIPATGMATVRCIVEWKGNGRCDLVNDHPNENCEYDGGDCCIATCQLNCASDADIYDRNNMLCEHFCGSKSYMCLDDEASYSPITSWCTYGAVRSMSDCYATRLEVLRALFECMLSNRSHGNEIYAAPKCGNRTDTCTELDIELKNGCHLDRDGCFHRDCCDVAIRSGFIPYNPVGRLPTLAEIYDACAAGTTEDDEPCFKYMVKCVQDNRAVKGGCCQCDPGWSGWRCQWPICWPICVHGKCVAPDRCQCEEGWKGLACEHPKCDPECVAGQGVCAEPNKCQCFYGWVGDACEIPSSVPDCVNGDPVSPDVCKCADGWGGRLCDYPLCQTWPAPSTDCGHGSCVGAFKCECEPGWSLYLPMDGDGYDIKPFWSKGQDVTQAMGPNYVMGDSRINFVTQWDRFYNTNNAPRCEVANCMHIFDPRCVKCEPWPGICLECESGFFVDNITARCERCSNLFPHCHLCGPVSPGPDPELSPINRCLLCDPLYVLQEGLCISDGTIEFGSAVYHVYKDEQYVNLRIQRSPYILEPASALPVEVLVRTRDRTAHSRSIDYGGGLANFEFTAGRVKLKVNPNITLPEEGALSTEYDEVVADRVQPFGILPVKIFDDTGYYRSLRYFDVELILPPEHIVGHQGPLAPFLAPHDHETRIPDVLWNSPDDLTISPLREDNEVLSTARVYIWDREEADARSTYCTGACQEWRTATPVFVTRTLHVHSMKADGNVSTALRDRYVVQYLPMAEGFENAIGSVTETVRLGPSRPGVFWGWYTPQVPGVYKVLVEKIVNGIYGQYWWHRSVDRRPPNLPDTSRIDHHLNFYWSNQKDAPSFVRWRFNLNFECIQTKDWPAGWPLNFGHALGIVVSPGSKLSAYFWNDGLVDEIYVPRDAVVNISELHWNNCTQSRPSSPFPYFICIELLFRNPVVNASGMYSFMFELETPQPGPDQMPVYVSTYLWHRTASKDWGWQPIETGCVFTSGLDIAGSPFEDFEALAADISPENSFVEGFKGEKTEVSSVVGMRVDLKVDLYDTRGMVIKDQPSIQMIMKVFVKTRDGKLIGRGHVQWNPMAFRGSPGFYHVTYTPETPDKPEPGDDFSTGSFARYVHVQINTGKLGGMKHVRNSPIQLNVRLAVSHYFYSGVIEGSFNPMRASEYKWFRIRSRDVLGVPRVTGGDIYDVSFVGPEHNPRTGSRQYKAKAVDEYNGSYFVDFEIRTPGVYEMHVLLNGVPIRGSPFKDVTVWDEFDASLTTAEGTGVDRPAGSPVGTPATIPSGELVHVLVIVRDTFGVQYYTGGARLNVTVGGLGGSHHDVLQPIYDEMNGAYRFSYRICKSGLTFLDIKLHTPRKTGEGKWQRIHGSPFALEVVPGVASPHETTISQPPEPVVSGVASSAVVHWRDACGNLLVPDAMGRAPGSVRLQNASARPGPAGDLALDLMHGADGITTAFFTPGRQGEHMLMATVPVAGVGEKQVRGSPAAFNITFAKDVPAPGIAFVEGSVGASEHSIYDLTGSPAIAGQPAEVRVQARDWLGDPLARENDIFIVALWREGGRCPSVARCQYFAWSRETCAKVPACRWDLDTSECRPRCRPDGANTFSRRPFRLSDQDATVELKSSSHDEYVIHVTSRTAGHYKGTISVLRPGGLEVHLFNHALRHRRLAVDMVYGPLDLRWRTLSALDAVPTNRFFAQLIGWLRISAKDTYTFFLDSDGAGEFFLNDTSHANFTVADGRMTESVSLYLEPGFYPLRIEYNQWTSERVMDQYLRLYYSAVQMPFQIVPPNVLFFEKVLRDSNPFDHIVRPEPRAATLSIEGNWSARPVGTAGVPYAIRLHSIDKFGNALDVRDPTASVALAASPLLEDAELETDVLAASRWRLTPLANGSFDVVVRPDAAPLTYNLSFVLSTLEAGGIKFRRQVKIDVEPNDVFPPLTRVVCVPPAPQPAGTRVTCTVAPRDLERNDLSGHEIRVVVRTPDGDVQGVEALPRNTTRAREFRFWPSLPGTWIVEPSVVYDEAKVLPLPTLPFDVVVGPVSPHTSEVVAPRVVLKGEPFELTLNLRDAYRNDALERPDLEAYLRGGIRGGINETALIGRGIFTQVTPSKYSIQMPVTSQRTSYSVSVGMFTSWHNQSLTYCPELLPVRGRVVGLTKHRAFGSVALLECLPGYERLSGASALRCEHSRDGSEGLSGGEWRELDSQQAAMLVCTLRAFWCPPLTWTGSAELVRWDWRREIGTEAELRCSPGHRHLLGDAEIVCGARGGRGAWLSPHGDEAVRVVCAPVQSVCEAPAVEPHVLVLNVSNDLDAGSVAIFGCEPGFREVGGDKIVVCDASAGRWMRPDSVTPLVEPEVFRCEEDVPTCKVPMPVPQLPCTVKVTYNHRRLGGEASFECVEGCERVYGDTGSVCYLSRSDSSRGEWFSGDPAYFGQVDSEPLMCEPVQNWCSKKEPVNGIFVSLSNEWYLGSIAELACDKGFERVSGSTRLKCGHNAARTGGEWVALDGGGSADFLVCDRIEIYCPMPLDSPGAGFAVSDGQRLGSRLSMSCSFGYEPDVPREVPAELFCQRGPEGEMGQWATVDGMSRPLGFLKCRRKLNWCPELSLRAGRVTNVTGGRRVHSDANLECDLGFELYMGDTKLPDMITVVCTIGTPAGGVWVNAIGGNTSDVYCRPTPNFCPGYLPAYTMDLNGKREVLDLSDEFYTLSMAERSNGSIANLSCNDLKEYSYSYGDTQVVCGYNEEGTGGAWRALGGYIAVPLHCYFSGSPVKGYVHKVDFCFDLTHEPIPVFFERQGSIMFWLQPMEWSAGMTVIQGTHGGGRWTLMFVEEGILEARVDERVGQVAIDMTFNNTRSVGEWFHLTFTWRVGVGLAGQGQVKLYVDGELAQPVERNLPGDLGEFYDSDFLSHFTWVEPNQQLQLGGVYNETIPAVYSNLRIWTRESPEWEIELLRSVEDPRCGFGIRCPTPLMVHSHVVNTQNPDVRFSLWSRRPETDVFLECDPGYVRFDGSAVLTCNLEGSWGTRNMTEELRPLRCCKMEQTWCPAIDLSDYEGAIVTGSTAPDMVPCAGIQYLPCRAIEDLGVAVTYTKGLQFGSIATLTCAHGYQPDAEFMLPYTMSCKQGVFTGDLIVPGEWTTPWRTYALFRCVGVQNFCPEPQMANMHRVGADFTDGRRTGSTASLRCLPGYEWIGVTGLQLFPNAKNSDAVLHAECVVDKPWTPGVWVIQMSGRFLLEEVSCRPVPQFCPTAATPALHAFPPMTGFRGDHVALVEGEGFSWSLSNVGRHRSLAQIGLEDPPYAYSYGDEHLICGYDNDGLRGVWRSFHDGEPFATALHGRDVRPAVPGAVWYSNKCYTDQVSGEKIEHEFALGYGAIALWARVPVLEDGRGPSVLWTSASKPCADLPGEHAAKVTGRPDSLVAATANTSLNDSNDSEFDGSAGNMLNDSMENDSEEDHSSSRRLRGTGLVNDTQTMNMGWRDPNTTVPPFRSRCLGDQRMLLDGGRLEVQLGDGLGNFSLDLASLGLLPGQWMHIAYTWWSQGQEGNLFVNVGSDPGVTWNETSPRTWPWSAGHEELRLKVDNASQATREDNDSNYTPFDTKFLQDRLEPFYLYTGLGPVADFVQLVEPPPAETTLFRTYNGSLSELDVAAFLYFERPRCNLSMCPDPRNATLNYSRPSFVSNYDTWQPPFPREPGSRLHMDCSPFHRQSGGQRELQCGEAGEWVELESGEPAEWLACCYLEDNVCPDIGPLYSIIESWLPDVPCGSGVLGFPPPETTATTTVQLEIIADMNASRDALYDLDPNEGNATNASSSRHDSGAKAFDSGLLRMLRARARLGCPLAYTQIGGSSEIVCASTWASRPNPGRADFWDERYRQRGQWVDESTGALAEAPVCELTDRWCPDIRGESSYLVNITNGQRLGSTAYFMCLDNYFPTNGNVTIHCVTRDDQQGGRWVDSTMVNDAVPLSCTARAGMEMPPPQAAGINANAISRQYHANVTLGCLSWYNKIHGDNPIYCMLAPTGGRWGDTERNNADFPICELRANWCPPVSNDGYNSAVDHLTDSYNYGSIASLRCHLGYTRVNGSQRLLCVNDETGLAGQWEPAEALSCELARHFCPVPLSVNATMVERNLEYKIGEKASFRCNRGHERVSGDVEVVCGTGNDGNGAVGEWKRLDGIPASPVVCAPTQGYCSMPSVKNGYVVSSSDGTVLGSAVELRCRGGFADRERRISQRTAVCLHDASSQGGRFFAGISHRSRDLLRAISALKDILLTLEVHEARRHGPEASHILRQEDEDTYLEYYFRERWQKELREVMGNLLHDETVNIALGRLVHDPPVGVDATTRFSIIDVRAILRLLIATSEEAHDISAAEALELFGAYDKLKINFQDADAPTPEGWLPDVGQAFGDRGNGWRYGWKCGVDQSSMNEGAKNRNRSSYTVLENTLVVTDTRSACDSQEWRIALPPGRYRVELTIQDPQYETTASGCLLQGEPLHFPGVVGPPGTSLTRSLTVDVVDVLRLTADGDSLCSSLNRISIQSTRNVSASIADDPLLSCEPIQDWCAPLAPPSDETVQVVPRDTAAQPLGGTLEFGCRENHNFKYGVRRLFCGADALGRSGQWRLPGGSEARLDLSCFRNRSHCAPPSAPEHARVTYLSPLRLEVGSEAVVDCIRGFEHTDGVRHLRCGRDGNWRHVSADGRDGSPLKCNLVQQYCPPLNKSVARLAPIAGHWGAAAAEAKAHQTHTTSLTVPVSTGLLSEEAFVACPEKYHRVGGDAGLVCGHGVNGQGRWQPRGAGETVYVDSVEAELVTCQLDTGFGLRRLYYGTAHAPHGSPGSVGEDIVPNIDFDSEFDTAHYEGHLKVNSSASMIFTVETVGRFLLSLDGSVLLSGRSSGTLPQRFSAQPVELLEHESHEISLQYRLDPALAEEDVASSVGGPPRDAAGYAVKRRLRLLWAPAVVGDATADGLSSVASEDEPEPVPPDAFRHGFTPIFGTPRILQTFNDPEPCSETLVTKKDLVEGDSGFIFSGSNGRDYNPDLHCKWTIIAKRQVRFNVYVNYLDLEISPGCKNDRLEVRRGSPLKNSPVGTFCGGTHTPGTALLTAKDTQLLLDFYTDGAIERPGFNITWYVVDKSSPPPPGTTDEEE